MARSLVKQDEVFRVREADLGLSIPPDEDAVYHVQVISPKEYQAIREKHVTKQFDRRTHQKQELEQTPEQGQAMTEELLDKCLVGWSGVRENGIDVPCDGLQRKLMLPRPIRVALVEVALTDGASTQQERRESFREPPPVVRNMDRPAGSGTVLSDC